jgi:hypothetical protein
MLTTEMHTTDDMRATERLARAIAAARHGTDSYWPNYLLAAVSARREMQAIIDEANSPEVASLAGNADSAGH